MNSLTMPATRSSALPAGRRRAAFWQIVLNEARLTWRRPIGLIGGVAIPLLLLIIFGLLPAFKQVPASFGGQSIFDAYVPILAAFGLANVQVVFADGLARPHEVPGILGGLRGLGRLDGLGEPRGAGNARLLLGRHGRVLFGLGGCGRAVVGHGDSGYPWDAVLTEPDVASIKGSRRVWRSAPQGG